ncbi:MAG: signal peptidase I [Dehalococcoidia bacterium]|nr:signal peptidase I [Dehalococcoidia bacterium]
MKKIVDSATIAVVVLLMVIATLVYLSPRFGYRADLVVSDSMEPVISVGTMVLAAKTLPTDLKVDDIITFKPVSIGEKPIAHRIIEVKNTFPPQFQTKGDNLPGPDPFVVPAANVTGRVVFHFPTVGYFIGFLKTTTGLVIALVIPALITIWFVFRLLWKELVRYIRSSTPKES